MSGLTVLRLARHHLLPVLVDRDVHRHDDALGVLRLRPSMFRDHGFDRYERALRGLIANR